MVTGIGSDRHTKIEVNVLDLDCAWSALDALSP